MGTTLNGILTRNRQARKQLVAWAIEAEKEIARLRAINAEAKSEPVSPVDLYFKAYNEFAGKIADMAANMQMQKERDDALADRDDALLRLKAVRDERNQLASKLRAMEEKAMADAIDRQHKPVAMGDDSIPLAGTMNNMEAVRTCITLARRNAESAQKRTTQSVVFSEIGAVLHSLIRALELMQ